MDFKSRLIEERKARGLTQEELAKRCKITSRTIQRIESGQVQPRPHTIRAISEILDFDFYESTKTHIPNSNYWSIKNWFNLKTNKMRKLTILSLTAVALILTTFLIQARPVNNNPKNGITISYDQDKKIQRVDVVFTNELTLDSLISIKQRLSDVGIYVDYQFMEFDEDGRLTGIACKMRDQPKGEGNSGYFKTAMFSPEVLSGFYFDYSQNAKEGFCCGSCWMD